MPSSSTNLSFSFGTDRRFVMAAAGMQGRSAFCLRLPARASIRLAGPRGCRRQRVPVGELADPLAPAAPLEVPELDPVPDPEVDPVPEPMLLLPEVEPPELVSEPVPLEPDVEPEARPVPLLDVLPLP